MSAIEYSNTLTGINKLKQSLSRITKIFSYISIIAFSFYYIFLIYKNLSNIPYLAIYSVLFIILIISFLIDILFKKDDNKDKKSNQKSLENKNKWKLIIKVPKYITKGTLVILSIYETYTNANSSLQNIFNIIFAIMLLLQILSDVIIWYITSYIDYLTKCIKQDLKESKLIKTLTFFSSKNIANSLENFAYKLEGESPYTKKEEKIYKQINENTQKFKQEQKNKQKLTIKKNIKKITNLGTSKIKNFISRKATKKETLDK